jgi:hypothetical protein
LAQRNIGFTSDQKGGIIMTNKVKGILSILFISVTFYMMITTRYTHALGDYLLEFIGLKSWTGNYNGIHLTIFYFGILFILGLFLVQKYATSGLNIKGRNLFIIFVVLILTFASITGMTARIIKKYSSGLLTIGYVPNSSSMNYKSDNKGLVEFTAEFKLTNYSGEKKTFHIIIDNPFYSEDEINFYTFNGELAIFELDGKETKTFSLSLEDYNILSGYGSLNGSGIGVIREIVLSNDKDNKVRLYDNYFYGIELGR